MLPIVPAIICRVCENNSLLINLATDSKKPIVKKLRACADIQVIKTNFPNAIKLSQL